MPAVLDGNRHTHPPTRRQRGGEILVPTCQPGINGWGERAGGELFGNELTDLGAKCIRRGGVDGRRRNQPRQRQHQRVFHFAMSCSCSGSRCANGCIAAAIPSVDSSEPVRDSWSRRLAMRNECAGFLLMCAARDCAAVSNSSCGTTRLTLRE